MSPDSQPPRAIRATLTEDVQGAGLREATRARATALGLFGWVRSGEDAMLLVHAEGSAPALEALVDFLRDSSLGGALGDVRVEDVRLERHEQFATRGVSAGTFVLYEHAASTRHFDLRLEVDDVMRSWALPKGPSLDPTVKRLAVEVDDHPVDHHLFEGRRGQGAVLVWDRGQYEQGGRVSWPEAIERGHAVFVLHGQKLRGGFALQRTRSGPKPQWLLVKRRDDEARPGSDVVAEAPASVLGGQTLGELLAQAD